jgi:hypothetical protein
MNTNHLVNEDEEESYGLGQEDTEHGEHGSQMINLENARKGYGIVLKTARVLPVGPVYQIFTPTN